MPQTDQPLNDLLADLRGLGKGKSVQVGDILVVTGAQSHAIALLVPAMILVSPLSAIFGLPTITAIVMCLIIVQALLRRRYLWVPGFLRERRISSARFLKALGWLESPVAWVERHQKQRLRVLVSPPVTLLVWLASLALSLIIPLLELLPMTTSLACLAITLMALGLILRDGLYVLAGFAMIGAFGALLFSLVGG